MISRSEVYKCIDSEREFQDLIWPLPEHMHSVLEYLSFIETYAAEARKLLTYMDTHDAALPALRKIAAIAVAAMEIHPPDVRVIDPDDPRVKASQARQHKDGSSGSMPYNPKPHQSSTSEAPYLLCDGAV